MTEVLSAPIYGASHFSPDSLRSSSHPELSSLGASIQYPDRTNIKHSYLHTEYESSYSQSAPSTAPSSPQLTYSTSSRRASYSSTPASSLSLDARAELEEDDFPSFEIGRPDKAPSKPRIEMPVVEEEPPPQPISSPREELAELPTKVNDDQAVEREPTRHVDYLSHDWKEEDIWSSWRYVVARRAKITNSMRLENASWRTWMKAKNNLKTITPETLNWMKDCDVTWLYGPLQTDTKKRFSTSTSPPPSRLSHSSSFIHKKPILKKKSASAAILERSISQQSLLKQAGALLRAQQSSPAIRPAFTRGVSDFSVGASYSGSSTANTPAERETPGSSSIRHSFTWTDLHSPSDSKHVNFSETVRQVQAIESDDEEKEEEPAPEVFSDDEDDDGGLMMRPSTPRQSNRSTPRGSFSSECKTIAALPSTTLKYRADTPEPDPLHHKSQSGPWSRGRQLSPSPSQETLRPPKPSHNFLIDDTDEDPDVTGWQPPSQSKHESPDPDEYESLYPYQEAGPGMRRTASGMFMPYDENEAEAALNNGIFKQALNVANTVKDIGYVIWNAGWSRRST